MNPGDVFDADGKRIGSYQQDIVDADGDMILVSRDEEYGGGTIVVTAEQVTKLEDGWKLPYGELSVLEAPPYSPNVDLHAYFEFWRRLGAKNTNISATSFQPKGSGPVKSDVDLADGWIHDQVENALTEASGSFISYDLIDLSVNHGTVLLEGYQNDTVERLAAATIAASIPGVKEIVNMLVVRAI
jgi:hypothetical protein